jgi:CheY-like chemotaxis protein
LPSEKIKLPPSASAVPASPSEKIVLVIDDSDIARAQMANLLVKAGMKVITLPSPIGATRTIFENNVNVAVIDLLMPGMPGDRLAALFRGNPRLKHLAVVLVSGQRGEELARASREAGADEVVSKLHLEDLAAAVFRACLTRNMHV